MVFSAIGICAVALAVLGQEWKGLYQLNVAVKQTQRNNQKIEDIIKDHQILTARIIADANILKRLAPVTLGVDPCEPNQPAVKITADTLARAKAVLEQQEPVNSGNPEIPVWLARCTVDDNRLILFSAGAGLIAISFAFFGKIKNKKLKTVKRKSE